MKILVAVLATITSLCAAAQEQTGRILVTIGVCKDSIAEQPVLRLRKADRSAHRNIVGPILFPTWDYSDDIGKFKVFVESLSAGDWELFNHQMVSKPQLGTTVRHSARLEYSHRFRVEPGKLVDLGRFCAATQSTGETFADSPGTAYNQIVRLVYMHVSPTRDTDIENARKPEGNEAPLEIVQARPNPPERVSPLLKGRFIEPRVITKPSPRDQQ